jgi:hypothetical protein
LFIILSLPEFAPTKYHLQLSFLRFFPSNKYKCSAQLHFLPFSFNYKKCTKVYALPNGIFSVQQIANTCAITRMTTWYCPIPMCRLLVRFINLWSLVVRYGPYSQSILWSFWWIKEKFQNIWYNDWWDVPIDTCLCLKSKILESSIFIMFLSRVSWF